VRLRLKCTQIFSDEFITNVFPGERILNIIYSAFSTMQEICSGTVLTHGEQRRRIVAPLWSQSNNHLYANETPLLRIFH